MAENFTIDLNNKKFVVSEDKKPVIPEIKKSANEEKYFTQLRDCFNAGYQFPQYCIDNNIKKPLFVGVDENQKFFLWEIYAQFKFDKITPIQPQFVIVTDSDDKKISNVNCFSDAFLSPMRLQIVSEKDLENFDNDGIIVMTTSNNNVKICEAIYLNDLVMKFFNRTFIEIPLLHFLQDNPSVKIIGCSNLPFLREHANNTKYEKYLLNLYKNKGSFNVAIHLKNSLKNALNEGKTISTPYDFLGYSNETVYRLLKTPMVKVSSEGIASLEDDDFLGIRNGRRMTANQPKKYKNTIYFLGHCICYGYGVPYEKTFESHLQKLLSNNDLPYRVENVSSANNGRKQDAFYILNQLDVKPGDMIFIHWFDFPLSSKIFRLCDLNHILDAPHNYGECFSDGVHINENGHRAVADYLFKYLTKNNFFQDVEFNYPPPPLSPHRYGIPKENFSTTTKLLQNLQLEDYKNKLRKKRISIGCIVMNCNPFTKGHEYLVEYASSRVNKLYIFVVEEDKSKFKFEDRFKLVQEGTKQFPNVEVIPSGQFIISQQTFSGYFNKESLQDVQVDSSEDVEIFAREIAPTLGITVRFVGQEPEDTVTNQYNENMKRILPQHNIDVCEIPRREIDGEVISAKKVRKALEAKDFDKIKKLVPKTTYDFLVEKFSA